MTHNNIALICRPGVEEHQEKGKTKDKEGEKESQNMARAQDCASVRAVLKKELGLTVVDLESPEARLSGSDVLFTGRGGKYVNTGSQRKALAARKFP